MSVQQDPQGTHKSTLDVATENGSAPTQLLKVCEMGLAFPHLQQK